MTPPGQHHADAIAAGANCAQCPLKNAGAGPVPPLTQARNRFLVVGEFPSPLDVDNGTMMNGPAGREVRTALAAGGMDPNAASYTNAILCRPPGADIVEMERDCKRKGIPGPTACCKPRLDAEIAASDFTLYVGTHAAKAGGLGSAMQLRGTPVREGRGLVTVSPSFVMVDSGKLFRGLFHFDVAKAVRLARGGGTWAAPEYVVATTPYMLADALAKLRDLVAVDTETDGIDPWKCGLRRIGFSDGAIHVIYAPLSVSGQWLVPANFRHGCNEVLSQFFVQPHHYIFHNFYGFDSVVLAQHGMPVNETNLFDSLVGHHIGATSEFPHKLDFLGSVYTDAPYWKGDWKHTNVRDDATLDRYLSCDIAVTHRAGTEVRGGLERSGEFSLYTYDAALSSVGRNMSALGVRIDSAARAAFVAEYETRAGELLDAFHEAAGGPVNPASVVQLKRLFYQKFGLPVHDDHRTDTGEPSTGEPALLDLLARGVDGAAAACIQSLLGWRECDKILGTYVGRSETEDREGAAGLPTHEDSRIRATWKVYGTTSGRWSSSPNLQNIPDKLRSMFVPAPGNVFVGADYSAVELRILALLSNDEILIKAFDEMDRGVGPDVHTVNACTLFKCTPDKVTKEVRTFAKRFVYGLSYGAQPAKIFQTLSLLRDEKLEPVFQGLELRYIEEVYNVWWKAHPNITTWRRDLIRGWRKNGFIATPWHGRRRYFVGGENHEEMYNHPIQGAAADLQNTAVLTLTTSYPFDYARSRGLVLQVHDALIVECGIDEAPRVRGLVTAAMEKTIGPMRFPAEAKTGETWKDV